MSHASQTTETTNQETTMTLTTTQMTTLRAIENGQDNTDDLRFELDITAAAARGRVKTLAALGLVDSSLGDNAEGSGRSYLSFELTNTGMDLIDAENDADDDEAQEIEHHLCDDADEGHKTPDMCETPDCDHVRTHRSFCGECFWNKVDPSGWHRDAISDVAGPLLEVINSLFGVDHEVDSNTADWSITLPKGGK